MAALGREGTIQMGREVTGMNLHRNEACPGQNRGEVQGETVPKMPRVLSVQKPALSDKALWLQTRHLAYRCLFCAVALILTLLTSPVGFERKIPVGKYSESTIKHNVTTFSTFPYQ